MVATYTPNLRLTKQGDNDNPNSWGDVLNAGVIALIEDSIAGLEEIDVTGTSDVNIATTTANGSVDDARHAILKLTGVIGNNINLIVPTVEKIYVVWGAHTGGNVTVKPTSGSGVSVEPGDIYIIFTDGSNAYAASSPVDESLFLQVANNLSDVASVATARTNLSVYSQAEVTAAITAAKEAQYPIGSLYFNASVATNPNTLLGFGTWTAYAAGRVLIGVGTGTDANAVQETFALDATGGEYEHTLLTAEMPLHKHFIAAVSSDGTVNAGFTSTNQMSRRVESGEGGDFKYNLGGVATAATVGLTSGTGGDGAHNNIQPYIAVHIWERIA